MVRRVHPYTFSIIYASVSVLALTENNVLNATVVGITIAQAQAVCMLYMQVVWYWAGKMEKQTHEHPGRQYINPDNGDITYGMSTTHAAGLYTTKEMQYALYLALVAIPLLAILQTIGPFDYNTADISIRGAPLLFLAISVFGTLYLQGLQLDDVYGKEKAEAPPDGTSPKARLVWYATRITGGKLGVSLLLIAFGTLYELNLVGHYFRETRAYTDKLPERAWQYDTASKYTIGTGFLPALTTYL